MASGGYPNTNLDGLYNEEQKSHTDSHATQHNLARVNARYKIRDLGLAFVDLAVQFLHANLLHALHVHVYEHMPMPFCR